MKFKSSLMKVVAIVMTLGILTSCAKKAEVPVVSEKTETPKVEATKIVEETPTEAKPVTIKFWGGWTGPDGDTMRGIVEKYMSENKNVTIEFESQQWTPLFTKFLADASAGDAPQILAMRPMELGQFIELGVLDDSFASTIGINNDDYSTAAIEGTMFDGKQYGIPLDQHMHGLYYNKELFEKSGITEIPKTGEELIKVAQKLTIDKNGKNITEVGFDKSNIVQYGFGFNINHHIGFQLSALLSQQGDIPFTKDMEKVDFNDDKAIKALQFLQDFVYKYGVTPVGEKSPIDDFIAGKVAMIIDGPWQMPKLEESSVQWESAQYPIVFDKQVSWGNAHIFTFPVTKSTDEQKQAVKDFILWLDKNSGEWAKSGQIPASKAGLEIAKTLKGRQAFIDSMENMYLLPASPKSSELFGSSATSPFVVAAQDLMLNNKPATDVVKELKKEMDSILSTP